MRASRSLPGIAFRGAAFIFLIAGTAALTQAQQPSFVTSLLASETAPASLPVATSSSSASSSDTAVDPRSDARLSLSAPAAPDASQPPPRRYGRPNFSHKTSNADGSNKYEFLGAIGAGLPVGNTHAYETPNWGFQVGGGRNFNQNFGIVLQFDEDHFGLQAATLANRTYIYGILLGCTPAQIAAGSCVTAIDGNNRVWSFTLNPTFTLATQRSWDAYAVVGGGFYHKVTNFTQPTSEEQCSIYGCGYFTVNANIDHYTSNAAGVNGGFGLTWKFSSFSNAGVFLEARYVLVLNQQRTGVTTANVSTAPAGATNFYPANSNRTTYIPIKLGIRF